MHIFGPNVHEGEDWSDAFFEESSSFDAWISDWASGVDLWARMYGEGGHIAQTLSARHPEVQRGWRLGAKMSSLSTSGAGHVESMRKYERRLMRTHVEFRSDAFPAQPAEDQQINPGRWGRVLADYLRRELAARGIETHEPIAEDWGWCIRIQNTEFPLWVGCGNYEQYTDGFLCFIEPRRPFIRKLLRKIDTTKRVGQVAGALDAIFRGNQRIREVRWWSEDEVPN